MPDQEGRENGAQEGLLGMGAELLHMGLEGAGVLGHGLAALPLAGTVIHGGLGAYHAYEMQKLNGEANESQDPNESARLRAEAIKEGHEVEQNAIEAIPFVGTGFGIASLAYNTGMIDNPNGESAAEKIWGEGAPIQAQDKVDVRGNPILDSPMPAEPAAAEPAPVCEEAMADRDLSTVGRRAFGWIIDHLAWFRGRAVGDRAAMLRVKRLAELAALGGALTDTTPGAAALLPLAWQELDEGASLTALLATQPAIACAYLPFWRADLRSTAVERRLADPAWRLGHARWPLFVRYGIGHVLESIGITPPWDQAAVLVARGLFEAPGDASPALDAALLAHVVMWKTDMGRNPLGLGPRTTSTFQALVPAWIRVLTAQGLLDPLGEIAIASMCVGGASSRAVVGALAAAQRDDGAVPPQRLARALPPELLYHSTIVAAMAALRPAPVTAQAIASAWGHLVD